MEWYHFLILFFEGFLLAVLLTPVVRKIAPKLGFIDHPGERKVHHQPKPLLGGAAIFISFLIVVIGDLLILNWIASIQFASENWITTQLSTLALETVGVVRVYHQLIGLLSGATLIFILGLIDDRFGLQPWVKLMGQVIAAIILYWCDIQIALFINYAFFNFCLTLFWIVLISNSFNLLDNMDGLSGGVAMISLILLGISTFIIGKQVFLTSITFVLAGTIAGFLRYNLYPSSIFMGDAGSMTLGYMVAALTVQSTFYQAGTNIATGWAVVMPVVILAVPIFDTLSVVLIRIKNGKPIFVGDKNHFSHRLVALGMSHRRAVFFIHLVTLCVGSAALVLPIINQAFGAYVVLTQTIIVFIIITMLEHINNNNHNKS